MSANIVLRTEQELSDHETLGSGKDGGGPQEEFNDASVTGVLPHEYGHTFLGITFALSQCARYPQPC